MKKIIITIVILLCITGSILPQTITVTSPAQSSKWCKGNKYSITWKKSGSMDGMVKVLLYQGGSKVLNIKNDTANDGSQPWTVPATVSDGSYTIRVITLDKNVKGESKPFTISSCVKSTITITSPKGGQAFKVNTPLPIHWQKSGTMSGTVRIILYRGKIKVLAISNSTGNDGSYSWQIPKSFQPGSYAIQISTTDNQVSATGPVFKIIQDSGGTVLQLASPGILKTTTQQQMMRGRNNIRDNRQNLIIHQPKAGDYWKPLGSYTVTWEALKKNFPASSYNFNIWLIEDPPKGTVPYLLVKNHFQVSKHTDVSRIYQIIWKFLGSTNIPSGKYKLKVGSTSNPEMKAEVGPIIIQNNISSSGTAFLGEDEPDIKIEDVYYDFYKKSIFVRIKNQGFNPFKGSLSINYSYKYDTKTLSTPTCPKVATNKKSEYPNISLPKLQSRTFLVCKWPCFDKRPSDYFPIASPVNFQLSIICSGKAQDSWSGTICKTKKADIILDTSFILYGLPGSTFYGFAFQKRILDVNAFKWISNTTFEARLGVRVRNWGCQGKKFAIKLHADGNYLNGKKVVTLGTIYLASGQMQNFMSKTFQISLPRDKKYHRLLLVAYQPELGDEGYSDAYKNNFVLTHVLLKALNNTVRGTVRFD